MDEAVTIGVIVADALSFCTKEVSKSLLGEAAKGAYRAFMSYLAERIGTTGLAPTQRGKVISAVDGLDRAEQDQLKEMVQQLLATWASDPGAGTVGTKIRKLKTKIARMTNLKVGPGGTGVKIEELNTERFEIENMYVAGGTLGKASW